jgi:hypothetical protein
VRYKATIYINDGNGRETREIVERDAGDVGSFKQQIFDEHPHEQITFGPIAPAWTPSMPETKRAS